MLCNPSLILLVNEDEALRQLYSCPLSVGYMPKFPLHAGAMNEIDVLFRKQSVQIL